MLNILIVTCILSVSARAQYEWTGNTITNRGRKYTFVTSIKTYEEARKNCFNAELGRLAEIVDQETSDFLKGAAASLPGGNEYFIGIHDGKWYSGMAMNYDNWCGSATVGPAVLKPGTGCWGNPTDATVGGASICEKRARPLSLADFYPVQYYDKCYLFSSEKINPYSFHFGTHDALAQACSDVGADPVRIGSDEENTAVAGMATCYFGKELALDAASMELAIGEPTAGYAAEAPYEDGHPLAKYMCTTMSTRNGNWTTRDEDGCLGYGQYALPEKSPYAVCKQDHVCRG